MQISIMLQKEIAVNSNLQVFYVNVNKNFSKLKNNFIL